LEWYDHNHRILPWRHNPHSKLSPEAVASAAAQGHRPAPADLDTNRFTYYVWVCEVMSQQTQVSRAAEYFRKWVTKWPDVESLATATQDEVNDAWAGLGYYRRARFLLEGAKYVVNERGGAFPTTSRELQKIPGVGPYTAAAIASIACGERAAVVDGNVIRVMARLRRIEGDPRGTAMTKLFAEVAHQALDPDRPGDFNQAVMELGATVCIPNAVPSCGACPVRKWCLAKDAEDAYKAGQGSAIAVTDYPTKVEKADKREETVAVAVVRVLPPGAKVTDRTAGKFLLVKRPADGLLAGLWEFPLAPAPEGAGKAQMHTMIDALLDRILLGATDGCDTASTTTDPAVTTSRWPSLTLLDREGLGEVVHVFSHIRMTMHVERIVLQGVLPQNLGSRDVEGGANGEVEGSETMWLAAHELEEKGLSSGVKKAWKLYNNAEKERKSGVRSIKNFFKPMEKAGAKAT
jgi:A/G-specific adenine glycosylase